MQEFNSAKEAILRAKPDAKIESNRRNGGPLQVTVKKGSSIVWQGDQRSLFGKYASRRSQAMSEITSKVQSS
eukprot:jgi/Tetstr1/432371/TSEL_021768.t1